MSMNVREAAVAGLFYEAQGERLRQQVDALMATRAAADRVGDKPGQAPPKALIVPHAGYVYSGETAAAAYACLPRTAQQIERVVLLGPAHRVYLQGMAVPSTDAFATPLGEVPLDRAAIERITSLPGVCVADEAHRQEHSLEVQLPFLQTVLGHFSLVPIAVGQCEPEQVAAVIDTLWGGRETLVIVSTDLSHFHDYEQARALDALTCDRIMARETGLDGEDACGAHALNGLMRGEGCRSLSVELLDLRNSGDSIGDRDRVVGYGAFLVH